VVISDQNSLNSKLPASYASNYLLMNPQMAKISAELAGRKAQQIPDQPKDDMPDPQSPEFAPWF
jgi:hypothetical protein